MSEAIPTQTRVSVPTSAPGQPGGVPVNSVGTEQLQNEAVTAAKIANSTITNAKIANGTVTEEKLAAALVEKIVPGAWTGLETLEKVEDDKATLETQAVGVRIEDGANARLRGALKATAKIPSGSKIFKIPAAVRPPATVFYRWSVGLASAQLKIKTNGEVLIELSEELAVGAAILLDGITWNVT